MSNRLGFQEMIDAGVDPADAWLALRHQLVERPELIELLRATLATPDGRDTLTFSRQLWAAYELPPPWEGLISE